MAAEPYPPDPRDEDELEESPLAMRLRDMSWPEAPAEVKQRVLDRILADHPSAENPDDDGNAA